MQWPARSGRTFLTLEQSLEVDPNKGKGDQEDKLHDLKVWLYVDISRVMEFLVQSVIA